ncbi:hypothetical protein FHS57_005104 [Runella defluvii]|uniref:Uncharacterized protein n=1 Tax=Runella defluvii TaxID=370973 RepID=A0A7W5ZP86_9BACT|nr:hypothetical protein [Runella defluvii]MBB3841083.1 hypothetical protein [Runella defluvii]
MTSLNIGYKSLTQKAIIRIHPEDITQIYATIKSVMYPPVKTWHSDESYNRTTENILRIEPFRKLINELPKWESSPKLWKISPNQTGMDVKIAVELAIVIFEICEASNSPELLRLKGNVQVHLKENFNIQLESTKHILS